jgi:hypothetical protein
LFPCEPVFPLVFLFNKATCRGLGPFSFFKKKS